MTDMRDMMDDFSFEIERLRAQLASSRSAEGLAQLGQLLRHRYVLTGSAADLDSAVTAFESALEFATFASNESAPHLSNLAAALYDRFTRNGDIEDLNRAIEAATISVSNSHLEGPDHPEYLTNFAAAVLARYEMLGNLSDLDAATQASEAAVELARGDARGAYLSNLSMALQARFRHTDDSVALDRAITFAYDAIGATAADDPARWSRLMTLGSNLILKSFAHASGDSADDALKVLALASREEQIDDFRRLQVADLTALAAVAKADWAQALEVFAAALDSTEGLFFERLESDVSAHRSRLASDAAACAIRLGNIPEALRLFDTGRARFLTGESRLRSGMAALEKSAPYLAGSLGELREYLKTAWRSSAGRDVPGARRDRSRNLELLWDNEVERVRQLPGFADFIADVDYSNPLARPGDAIVVVVNVSRFGSNAIIVGPDGTISLPLPLLSLESVADHARRYSEAVLNQGSNVRDRELVLIETLSWLWDVLGAPLADLLGSRGNRSLHDLPVIKWCPSGVLGIMPIHAAGVYGIAHSTSEKTLFAVARSSYVINVGVSIGTERDARVGYPQSSPSVLVVAPESEMPSVHLSMELDALQETFEQLHVLSGNTALRTRTMDEMAKHSLVHFAGHGLWDAGDSRASGILLEDGVLTVERLTGGRFENTQLMFLSASCTAARGLVEPDEFLSPASAVVAAGCPNVIGTMFSVRDSDASEFAAYFYKALTLGGGHARQAKIASATHVAVEALRRKYPETPSAWAGFIHLAG